MSKVIRAAVLSGALSSLLLVPSLGAAQDKAHVKVGKNGQVEVKTDDTSVSVDGEKATVQTGGAGTEAGGNISISGANSQETHRCSPKTEVEITGSDNEVTLTGDCKSVSVNGSGNKVQVEAAAAITVMGADNEVIWKRGVGAKKPKVSRTGTDNKVTQAR
ncbi:DUF3060 domain-containing protein [Archangium lipolyticum]|uniref:DUF3060 domain-containing protein n=1 Tax=Archangium lipolyticum TaxID=2970465 RepID=UPI00214A7A24|nr:DUF3060 domain-containing protein [Archangium lipolyticum]